MASATKPNVQKQRDTVRDNLITLLRENGGRLSLDNFWNNYTRTFPGSAKKKDLGLAKMADIFEYYPSDFEMYSGSVFLRKSSIDIHKQKQQNQPKQMPQTFAPLKPLWGSGSSSKGPFSGGWGSGLTSTKAALVGASAQPPSQGSSRGASTASVQSVAQAEEYVSLSDSDSSSSSDTDSDSDIQITGRDSPLQKPVISSQGVQKQSFVQPSSNFLSFEVPGTKQFFSSPQIQQQQPLVFNNRGMAGVDFTPPQQQSNPSTRDYSHLMGVGRAGMAANFSGGRGHMLDVMQQQLQQQRAILPQPLLTTPGYALPSINVGRGQHPGVMPAMSAPNQFPDYDLRQSRSSMSSESESSVSMVTGGVGPPRAAPHPPPPDEPTWPPSYPKLGIPPGVPRERKQVTVKPVPFQRGRLTKEQVEGVAQDCIEMLVEAGDHVSTSRIINLLLQRYNVQDLRDLQVPGVRFPYNISCINEHERLLSKVNASIEAFVLSRSICTLYDLERSLVEYDAEKKDRFEALRLGPLQCLPTVYDKFKFPQEEKIPEISTADVLDVLQEFLTKKQKWTDRLDMEEVMAYFVEYWHVPTAYSLGIRIRSLPLAAQVLKKSHRDAAATRKQVISRCMSSVESEVKAAFHKVKANIFQIVQAEGGESVEMRKHYAGMNAEAVMMELLEKYQMLLQLDMPQTKNERKRHSNIETVTKSFISVMQQEPLARALLHLSVCVGRLDLQEAAMELLAPKPKEEKGRDDSSGADAPKTKQPPSKASLIEKMKRYLERCLAQGSLTLSHLERVEEKLLEEFGFPTFVAMGFGRFLNFLLHDPAAKVLLDECGGISLGGSHQTQGHAHMTEVLEFLKQCKAATMTQETELEMALCQQFHVTEPRLLGFGTLRHLLDATDKPGKHHSRDYYRILYETAFCGKPAQGVQGKREVGILGHQSRDAALACLHSCPLLEDLEKWSHWSLVFEPQHGSLKDFLQKYGGVHTMHQDNGQKIITTDIVALETEPGRMLRLVSTTSPNHFLEAANRADAKAVCGHLASLVMGNRGVEHTPLALLANHTRSALFTLHTSTDVPGAPGQTSPTVDPAIEFVLHCLLLLPLKLCVAVANQVLLEPLGQVVGSSRSKSLILEACVSGTRPTATSVSSPLPIRELARLGCMLGIQEWTRPLTDTFLFPPDCVTVPVPQQPTMRDELLGDDDEEGEEQEEESEDSSSEEESSSPFLSDIDDDTEHNDEIVKNEQKDEEGDQTEAVKETAKGEKKTKKPKVPAKEGGDEDEEVSEDDEEEDETEGEEEMEEEGDELETEDDSGEDGASSESDIVETEEDKCRRIINQIQRDEFGVGVELSEDGQRLMKVQQERLGRSLDRLSRDLYSKDTHFVLELVQNADDNAYPDHLIAALETTSKSSMDNDCPSVRFIISKEGVTVLNNECGFREKDVRALCDVGRSTKGKHKYGYIGQKGIGFKSVFRVTSRPEVHSNCFHLCFDVDSGPMGYILPHWCDDTDPQEGWMTKIILPLKQEMAPEARSLAARFNDIHPSLLLFLHRLRSIHIDNKVEGMELSMRRVDLGDNIVEIYHGHGDVDRWLVVKKQLDASAISLQAKSGVEVESTEIALAFPLMTQMGHNRTAPAKQPVFAFLPLRSYGFRFIVQGDFDVPSSREDVDRDSSWNQWLRNEVHTLFIEAFHIFQAHPEFEGLESLWAYLQFVPLEDEILDFFKPVASQILHKMRAMPCMPCAVPGKKGAAIQWKLPSQTLMVQDSLVRQVISPELLEQHLGLHYVHREVASMLSPLLIRSLGVETITTDHLIQVGRSLIASWSQSVGDEEIVQISKWLACLYRAMDDFQENTTLISMLRSMRVIPLSTGELVSLEEKTVFMLSEASSGTDKVAVGKRDPLTVLREDLCLVHGGLTGTADSEVNSQVWKLLHKLDIKQLSAHDIVHHHILPVLRSNQWQSKDRKVLVSYLVYIKEQRSRNNSLLNMDELKSVARVLTNQGIKNPAVDNVHFTPAFGIKFDLSRMLPGYDWILLDGQYIPPQSSLVEIQTWRDFFMQLGVAAFLIVRQEEVQIKREDMDKTPWSLFKGMWPASEETYTIADFVCEEFVQLVNHNSMPKTQHSQLKVLFELLDSTWDTQYSRYANTQLRSGSSGGSVLKETIPSSFALALQALPWVLGVESTVERAADVVGVTEKESLLRPSTLYVPDPSIKRLLAHTVCYLAVPVSNTSTFSHFLHIKNSVEVSLVRDALIEWGMRDPSEPKEPAVFCSSQLHLRQVYTYLYENLTPKDAQDLFHHQSVIFVPQKEASGGGGQHQQVAGKMLGRDEVWWQDSSGLFLKYRQTLVDFHSPLANRHLLEHLYRDIQEKFLPAARVQMGPEIVDYAELLTLIASGFSLSEEGVLADVLSIYAKIGHNLSEKFDPNMTEYYQQQDQQKRVNSLLGDKLILATKGQAWVAPGDKPLLADDPEMAKMFVGKPGVHFLVTDMPQTHQSRQPKKRTTAVRHKESSLVNTDHVLAFLALFDIHQLSEDVVKEEIPEMFVPYASGQEYLRAIVPYIQRYLMSHYPDIQNAHHKDGMDPRLKELQFVKTKKLQVRYSLRSHPDASEIRDEKCVIMGSYFYFHEKHVNSLFEVNKEVARFFSYGDMDCLKDLRQFLTELQPILESEDQRQLERLLRTEDVDPLPTGHLAWEVPKPLIPKPPTPPPPPPPPPPVMPQTGVAEGGDDQGEGPSLRAWPPPAPGEKRDRGSAVRKQGDGKPMGASIWPPPKAPEEVQRQRNLLPSNIHVAPHSSDSEHKDSDSSPSDSHRDGAMYVGAGSAHPGAGHMHTGSGFVHDSHPGHVSTHKGSHPSQGSHAPHPDHGQAPSDGSRGREEGAGEGDGRRHDSGVSGADSRKRKSDELDMETSECKRPASDETLPQETPMIVHDEENTGAPQAGGQGHGEDGVLASEKPVLGDSCNDQSGRLRSFARRGWQPFRPRPDQLQLPVWTQLASETEYEELGRGGDLKVPSTVQLSEASNRQEIGRWGEVLVYDYLLQQKAVHDDIYEIIWTNQAEESGKPYDFEVICTPGDEAYTLYIEVKATRSSKKEMFEISSNEVKFASEQGERYHIYRIFNAGTTEQVQLVRLTNVSHKMDNKEVRLLMLI